MLRPDQLDSQRASLLVIDMQEKLLPLIPGRDSIIAAGQKLLDGAVIFGLPVLATEQYPKGLGGTDLNLRGALHACRAEILEKPTFSACGEPPIRKALLQIDRPQVILMGIEAHVCVQQSALDLAIQDYDVFVCADAIGSRRSIDYENALGRMRQAGVRVTTVESVLFELCGRCDTEKFKRMLEIIKRA